MIQTSLNLACDPETECWMVRNPKSQVVHTMLVPWINFTNCRGRLIDCGGWPRFWAKRHIMTCQLCRREPMPLSGAIPPGWPPFEEQVDCLIAADWWDEHDRPALAKRLRALGGE